MFKLSLIVIDDERTSISGFYTLLRVVFCDNYRILTKYSIEILNNVQKLAKYLMPHVNLEIVV